MSDRYDVNISPQAHADMAEIASYIRRTSPQNATEVSDRLFAAIDSLKMMPQRFRSRTAGRNPRIHKMLVYPYIVSYIIETSPPTVSIVTIRRGARRR